MAYKKFSDFIRILEENDELLKIEAFVSPELEIAEITDRFSKQPGGGKALLFLNTGTEFPVLTNALGSDKRMSLALGVSKIEDIEKRLALLLEKLLEPRKGFMDKLSALPLLARLSGFFPTEFHGKPPCQEVIINDPDLSVLPVLKTWPYDGGNFLTLPLVFTIDPESGERNVGMYRMQVFDNKTTGMHWHRHKTGANHYEKYKRLGKKMPVAVALGGDPAIMYSATAPLPENIDELILAGFLRGKSVALTPCVTQDISVPADSEIIIEGYVDPAEDKVVEGPFGDHTGFYSLEDYYPVFHVTCISYRKNAVYPATLVGIPPQEDAWIARLTERLFLLPMKLSVAPEIVDIDIPEYGVAHNLTIVSIEKTYPGQANKVMNALWGAGQMMFNKVLIVCDSNLDVHNHDQVFKRLMEADFRNCLSFATGPLDVLDHSADHTGFGSKLGIDLTTPFSEEMSEGHKSEDAKSKEYKTFRPEEMPGIQSLVRLYEGEDKLISVCSISKEKTFSAQMMAGKIKDYVPEKTISVFLLVDDTVNISSFKEFLWYFLNNMEPRRDVLRIPLHGNEMVIIIDGTAKNRENDSFKRDWPNPVVMDENTISRIDEKWDELGLGPLLVSPSVHYQKLVKNSGARAFRNSVL